MFVKDGSPGQSRHLDRFLRFMARSLYLTLDAHREL